MSTGETLILDIETIGEDFDSFDTETQKNLTRFIRADEEDEEAYEKELSAIKGEMPLSPLTGEIVSLGLLDYHKKRGLVLYQAPGKTPEDVVEGEITYRAMDEKKMLQVFWKMALEYDQFITFNGRSFDIPFLLLRSVAHKVRPTKDLMRGRYLYQQAAHAAHIDLYDQFSFYGAVRKKGSMHLHTRAFGIESPKAGGVDGGDVGGLFREGKYLDIAKYNGRDLFATSALFDLWNDYLRF